MICHVIWKKATALLHFVHTLLEDVFFQFEMF